MREVGVLAAREYRILCVEFGPQGKFLASSDAAGTITVWDTETCKPVVELAGHEEPVAACAFAHAALLAGSSDGAVYLWSLGEAPEKQRLGEHGKAVAALAVSPDGAFAASGDRDGGIRLWNLSKRSLERELCGHKGKITQLAYSPGGEFLASASRDGTLRLWRPERGEMTFAYHSPAGGIRSITFNPDGSRIVAGLDDLTLRFLDADDGQEIYPIQVPMSLPLRLCFLEKGRRLACALSAGLLFICERDQIWFRGGKEPQTVIPE